MHVQKQLQTELQKISEIKTKRTPKNVNERAAKWLKKAGYLEIDDLETVDYNNGVSLDDVQTVDYNNDTQPDELDNEIEKINLKNTSTQKTAKKNNKKIQKFKKKRTTC